MLKQSFIFAFILLSFSSTFSLDQISIESTGNGTDRENALQNAKKNAADKVIRSMLTTQIEIDSFTANKSVCISKIAKELKNLEILSEAINGTLYEIKIKSTISEKIVRKELTDLQLLIQTMNKPHIMVLISEENCGSWRNNNNIAENAIIKYLSEPYQFNLINSNIVSSIKNSKQRIIQLTNDISAAVSTGTQNGAEVLIIGTAVSKKAENDAQNRGGMISVNADVALKAINCTRGNIIGSTSANSSAREMSYIAAGNIAIENAALTTIKSLLDPIIKDWQGQLNTGITISVSISNVRTFRQKSTIIQTFNRFANISTVKEHIWNPETEILEFKIDYKDNPNEFYKKIDGYKLVYGGGSLLVTGIDRQKITLSAQAH